VLAPPLHAAVSRSLRLRTALLLHGPAAAGKRAAAAVGAHSLPGVRWVSCTILALIRCFDCKINVSVKCQSYAAEAAASLGAAFVSVSCHELVAEVGSNDTRPGRRGQMSSSHPHPV
jgi:hypothetical protein